MTVSEAVDRDSQTTRSFQDRHIGPTARDCERMLSLLGYSSLQAFLDDVVPASIRLEESLDLPGGISEEAALAALRAVAARNRVQRSLIGQGYYGTFTPAVIQRNVLENPAWYTAYTPYQAEISQGRLEALLNYQTMVADLTGMDIANASLLDEATAAAEAMTLCHRVSKSRSDTFFVHEDCFAQTLDVLRTRAEPLGIELLIGDEDALAGAEVFGALLSYPAASGEVRDLSAVIERLHQQKAVVAVAADLLALVLLRSPGDMGADVVIGSSQRFGVPLGGGGPHAAFMATRDAYKRSLPARLVGSSRDADGRVAHRLALQTREQHIRREKATSNICTAQVLLAVMAGMYAVYHGPDGLRQIATRVHRLCNTLASGLIECGFAVENPTGFDTLVIRAEGKAASIATRAAEAGINLRLFEGGDAASLIGVSLDETCTAQDVEAIWSLFAPGCELPYAEVSARSAARIPESLRRQGEILKHEVFHRYHSETEMLRYLRRLSDKDIALDRAMIPLGSCTMKLNATSEMLPVSWPEFSQVHPFAPGDQQQGYAQMVEELEAMLCEVTGYDAVSLQPNAGSQGEYAGLLAIRAYHRANGDTQRDVCLIPESAHGTNPASAQMCGMRVVVVACDARGNVDLDDLRGKAEQHSERLAALMVTYPSTHGVFEAAIEDVAAVVHEHGGQVYIDGANLNALVGLAKPGHFGGDVSHLNLHKTFCIPHGGGGPGVGPVAARAHLAPYLPGYRGGDGERRGGAVSAARWGSASILPISWMYMKMMGADGLRRASEVANLAANYVAMRLQPHYPILYTGDAGRVAHECIVDLRPLKDASGIGAEDVAKRLIDYGFHAPTMSFPVPGTLMIEPTESESLAELDRFCDAMIAIRREIARVEEGQWPLDNNPLVNSPHTADMLVAEEWAFPYTREEAVYPLPELRENKYWPPVRRVDNAYGDKNLSCSCAPISAYR